MSNIGSSALQTKQHTQTRPEGILPLSARQRSFNQGTINLLDEARAVVENAVGQGQQLNPMIYQMLGLNPTFSDHTPDLQGAQQEMDAAQQQWNQAHQTIATLQGIPKGKRSPAQQKQLRQLKKQMPALNKAVESAKGAFGQLQTMPKTITGFERMDPSQIPAESPFSAQNPLFQAQQTEAERLNQYLAGGEVDPTLKHQYDQAESALRAKLSQRYGPDFENTTVGQMALQNFARMKNEAFATYNQQQVGKYNDLAFGGAANLQNLLAGRIGLMREPSNTAMNAGAQMSNLAGARLAQQQTANQWALGHGGVVANVTSPAALATAAAGGLGKLLTTPYNDEGNTVAGRIGEGAGAAWGGLKSGAGALYNWATGAGAADGAGAGVAGVAGGLGGGAAAAEGGMSTLEGGELSALL